MTKKRKTREVVDLDLRLAISYYLKEGFNANQIGPLLGRNPSVIYHELKHRSQPDGSYDPIKANKMAKKTKMLSQQIKSEKLALNESMKKYIEQKLALKWSPRQIASEMEKDIGYSVTFATIYRYIKTGQVKVDKIRDMRRGGKKFTKNTEQRGKLKVGTHRTMRYRSSKNS